MLPCPIIPQLSPGTTRTRGFYQGDQQNYPLRIVGCGWESLAAGRAYHWEGSRRPSPETGVLQWTLRGRGLLHRRGRTMVLEPGTAMVISYPDQHLYERIPGEGWDFGWIAFQGSSFVRLWKSIARVNQSHIRMSSGEPVTRTFIDTLNTLLEAPMSPELRHCTQCMNLIMLVAEKHLTPEQNSASDEPSFLVAFDRLLEKEPVRNWQLKHLLKFLPVSRSHFTRSYSRHRGESPRDTIQRLKMESCLQQVGSTSLPLEMIALEHGFVDLPHFHRCFLRASGMSPGAYRKAHRP